MSNPAAPGRTLGGRYRLQSLLARGGMASVWLGDDTLLARPVAVKTLHPELAVDADTRTRFRNEAVAVASLAHPDIVATYDTGEDDGVAYLVMELVEGPNLRRLLDERGALPVAEALRIARGVTAALAHAHRNGIVHRDIKPANVLVPPHAPVKVTDFGIAKAGDGQDLTRTGTVLGTARYLSPEQLSGDPVDARADLYGVGLLLHEMLAGRAPFTGDSETSAALARLTTAPPPLRSLRPDIPPRLEAITLRCLALDPADRYPDAAALGEDLATIAGGADLHLASPGVDRTRRATPAPPTPRQSTAPVAPGPAPSRSAPARPAPARRASQRRAPAWPWALLGIFLLLAGAAGGYLIVRQLESTAGNGGGSGGATGSPQVTGAADFDPEGGDGENPGQADRATDGDASSAWSTESYRSPNFGGGKSGVGLRLELAGDADVSNVEVDTDLTGWSAQIYVAESPGDALADWGQPVASAEDLGKTARFEIDPAARGNAVLVWLTRLPSTGRLAIAEVRVA
ncbi:MAG: protein kinase [Acidimicrobiia bacterium]|nr:protein kinase [Acidimicrobiia bacterium]